MITPSSRVCVSVRALLCGYLLPCCLLCAVNCTFLLCAASVTFARDFYVHPEQGDNQNPGTRQEMLQTAQQAVNLAQPGDVIHLLPAHAVYRQTIVLRGKTDLTIEGNHVTLEGADPLPVTDWEEISPGLSRRLLPRTVWDRHLLIVDGKMERMGRSPTTATKVEFPRPEQLQPGQFCFETVDEKTGWLYASGPLEKLEWAVRPNGLATTGKNQNITVRNLDARHFLNDGFNIHGDATGLVFSQIAGYDCFDEGFSAHETCQCTIHHGKFWGNDNAVADVNDCETHYFHCEFRDSVSCDVLLIGRKHTLTNCRILNTTPAMALNAGPRGPEKKLFQLKLERLHVQGRSAELPARVRINGGQLQLQDNTFEHTRLDTSGATLVDRIP